MNAHQTGEIKMAKKKAKKPVEDLYANINAVNKIEEVLKSYDPYDCNLLLKSVKNDLKHCVGNKKKKNAEDILENIEDNLFAESEVEIHTILTSATGVKFESRE
jgi:hypothetical protein